MKAIIVGIDFYKDGKFPYYFNELEHLVNACEIEVVGTMSQKLPKIDSRTYLRSGKLIELKNLIEELDVELVILNNEISGSQNKNMEKVLECRVMDRTQLILEIFSRRAKTKEAKLQVGIAKLNYQKPRMIGSYESLDRQGGGSGTVSRGSGETKMETDKRKISRQILIFEKELEKIVASRMQQRDKRKTNLIPVVSLVGYTNAGKSTLMNALVSDEKQVFEKDMLFATLDTSVRLITLNSGMKFLLADTVGFVSNLPHDLVNAFKSTLEEIESSDLIIHLSDVSSSDYGMHKSVVEKTLKMLDVSEIEILNVNNKIDMCEELIETEDVDISAKNNINIDGLLNIIEKIIFKDYKLVKILLPYNKLDILSKFKEYTSVSNIVNTEHGVEFIANLSAKDISKYREYIVNE